MRVRYGAVALPTVAMGAVLLVGCNPSNEENLGGQTSKVVPHKEGIPDFKSYAEVQQYNAQQAAKNRSAGKGKAPSAPAPKQSEPESQKDQPKSQ